MGSRFSFYLLPFALALTCATQLRFSSSFGLGELLLCIWIALSLPHLRAVKWLSEAPARIFSGFWLLAILLLAVGAMTRHFILHLPDGVGVLHDAMAYGLVMAFTIVFSSLPYSNTDLEKQPGLAAVAFILPLLILWLVAQNQSHFGNVSLWYGPLRFRGWSENPNQTALILVTAPFLILHTLSFSKTHSSTLIGALLLTAAVTIGLAVNSRAAQVSWVGASVLLSLTYGFTLYKGKRKASRLLAILAISWLIALTITSFVQGSETKRLTQHGIVPSWGAQMETIYLHSSDGPEVRFALIMGGVKAVMASPIVGLGPGRFAGEGVPFQGWEAHNSYIDWATNTGMAGTAALLGILFWLARRLWAGQYFALLAGLVALAAFSSFHHVLRHPAFWFYLVLTARLSARSTESEKASEVFPVSS